MLFWPTASINKKLIAGSGIVPIGLTSIIHTSRLRRNMDGYTNPGYLALHGRISIQYAGLISSNFRETDVVLAARMRVRSAFEKEGRIQHIVHLCSGDWPDFFAEVVFGKRRSGPPVWSTGYLNRVFDYQGHSEYIQPGPTARPTHEFVAAGLLIT